MATLVPTAGELSHALAEDQIREATLAAGVSCSYFDVLYEDDNNVWQLADNDTDLSDRQPGQIGIALGSAPAAGKVWVFKSGVLVLDSDNAVDVTGLTHAETYVLGEDGAIVALGDLVSSDYLVYIGYGVDYDTDPQYGADALVVDIKATGQQKP